MESQAQPSRSRRFSHPTVDHVAEVLRLADPGTPWWYEGPVRHRVRAILILTRWTGSWRRADLEARRLVARGRSQSGVRMATGYDADTDLASWIGTNECPIDGRIFVPKIHNQIYCSLRCKSRAHYIEIKRAVFVTCGSCGQPLEEPTTERKYCSDACMLRVKQARNLERARLSRAARRAVDLDARLCAICSRPIPADRNITAELCGDHECARESSKLKKRDRRQRKQAQRQ
jgi:hypothetical protein